MVVNSGQFLVAVSELGPHGCDLGGKDHRLFPQSRGDCIHVGRRKFWKVQPFELLKLRQMVRPSLVAATISGHQGRTQDFSKGVSHCVKHYRHGVFATEYYRLFS